MVGSTLRSGPAHSGCAATKSSISTDSPASIRSVNSSTSSRSAGSVSPVSDGSTPGSPARSPRPEPIEGPSPDVANGPVRSITEPSAAPAPPLCGALEPELESSVSCCFCSIVATRIPTSGWAARLTSGRGLRLRSGQARRLSSGQAGDQIRQAARETKPYMPPGQTAQGLSAGGRAQVTRGDRLHD